MRGCTGTCIRRARPAACAPVRRARPAALEPARKRRTGSACPSAPPVVGGRADLWVSEGSRPAGPWRRLAEAGESPRRREVKKPLPRAARARIRGHDLRPTPCGRHARFRRTLAAVGDRRHAGRPAAASPGPRPRRVAAPTSGASPASSAAASLRPPRARHRRARARPARAPPRRSTRPRSSARSRTRSSPSADCRRSSAWIRRSSTRPSSGPGSRPSSGRTTRRPRSRRPRRRSTRWGSCPTGRRSATSTSNLLGSQVAGYYDPKAKQIFVVSRSGQIGAIEKITFAHEFTHALQDQNFGLEGIDVDAVGQGDRSLARLALVEGDATLLMTRWLIGHLTPAGLAQILAGDPAARPQLDAVPAIIARDAALPVPAGRHLRERSGRRAGGRPWIGSSGVSPTPPSRSSIPRSTRPASSRSPCRWTRRAMAAGWEPGGARRRRTRSASSRSGLAPGERRDGRRWRDSGDAAAAGWGGDRIAFLGARTGPMRWCSSPRWDTPADATEFATAATQAVVGVPWRSAGGAGRVRCSGPGRRRGGGALRERCWRPGQVGRGRAALTGCRWVSRRPRGRRRCPHAAPRPTSPPARRSQGAPARRRASAASRARGASRAAERSGLEGSTTRASR